MPNRVAPEFRAVTSLSGARSDLIAALSGIEGVREVTTLDDGSKARPSASGKTITARIEAAVPPGLCRDHRREQAHPRAESAARGLAQGAMAKRELRLPDRQSST